MNKIEEKYGLKPSHAIVLFIILLFNIVWIVCDLIFCNGNVLPEVWLSIIMFFGAVLYVFYSYKKPHGNLMRYLCLFQAVCTAIMLVLEAKIQPTYVNINYLTIIILISYMAGRLDHYKQNIFICAIVLICKFISSYSIMQTINSFNMLTLINAIACLGPIGVWLAIAGAYIVRYKPHKEAGFKG